MPSTVGQQIKILFRKNYLLMIRTHDIPKSLIFPLLAFILLYLKKNQYITQNYNYLPLELILVPISLMGVTRQIVFFMVEEKSTKQKEIQKIMGVKQTSYVTAWILTNLFKIGIVVLFFLALCIPTDVLDKQQFFISLKQASKIQLVIAYILFGLAQMAQSYFISVFFRVPKTARDVAVMLNLVGTFLVKLFRFPYVQGNQWVLYVMALFPSTCFSSMLYEHVVSFNNTDFLIFPPNSAIAMLVFDIVLYFLLYVYFDQVLPNEYGTHQSPLFFLQCRKQVGQVGQQDDEMNSDISFPLQAHHDQAEVQEDDSSAIFHQSTQISGGTIISFIVQIKAFH